MLRLPLVDANGLRDVPSVVGEHDARRRTVFVFDDRLPKRFLVLLEEVTHVREVRQFSFAHLKVNVRKDDALVFVLALDSAAPTALGNEFCGLCVQFMYFALVAVLFVKKADLVFGFFWFVKPQHRSWCKLFRSFCRSYSVRSRY